MSDAEKPSGTTINVTSHNQSGGITAHTVNIGKEQRQLGDEERAFLTSTIPKHARVEIQNPLGDAEAHTYRVEIQQFLLEQGYTNVHGSQGIYAVPERGQRLYHAPGSSLFQLMIFAKE